MPDGDPDAAFIDGAGKLHMFSNERQGQFAERSINAGSALAINVLDADDNGVLDLVVAQSDGAIVSISDKDKVGWSVKELARTNADAKPASLRVADLDNNGGLESNPLGATTRVWLSDGNSKFTSINDPITSARVFDIADINNDGRLDLLALGSDGTPHQAINQGTKNYHWQIVRPRASNAVGDQRINPFGVGGEMEIRSGMMVQKQPITGPLIHFGLGEQASSDVIRVVWPNGTVRAEFEIKADQEV
jgi:hypothetical protein